LRAAREAGEIAGHNTGHNTGQGPVVRAFVERIEGPLAAVFAAGAAKKRKSLGQKAVAADCPEKGNRPERDL
jgi:hypothetical protein